MRRTATVSNGGEVTVAYEFAFFVHGMWIPRAGTDEFLMGRDLSKRAGTLISNDARNVLPTDQVIIGDASYEVLSFTDADYLRTFKMEEVK